MPTETETIRLQIRAEYGGRAAIKKAMSDLAVLESLQKRINGNPIRFQVQGASKLDQFGARLRKVTDGLKAAGHSGLATAIDKDLGQMGRAYEGVKGHLNGLAAQMDKLNAAQAARPGAQLGPEMAKVNTEIEAHRVLLNDLAKLQQIAGASAGTFAKAEQALAAASGASGKQLTAQTAVLADKSKMLAAAGAAGENFAATEKKIQAAGAKNVSAAQQRARELLKEGKAIKLVTDADGRRISQVRAGRDPSHQIRETFDKEDNATRTDVYNEEKRYADALRVQKEQHKLDRERVSDAAELQRLHEKQGAAYLRLAEDAKKSGLEQTNAFRAITAEQQRSAAAADRLKTKLAQEAQQAAAVMRKLDQLEKSGYTRRTASTRTGKSGRQTQTVELFREHNNVRDFKKAVVELDEAGKPLNATLLETRNELKAVGNRASWATRNFLENTRVVVSWAASVIAYKAAFAAIRGTTQAVADLQRKSAVLTTIYQGERSEAMRLKDETMDLAVALGRTGDEALDAAVRFARLGLTRRQILEAVTVSLKAANVAEIEAGEAAEYLSSIMAAWGLRASELYGVLIKLNNVSNQFNTTNKDLLEGMSRVGALAKQSGLDMEALIGIIGTGVGLTGRKGAEFGNAIKSIIVSLSNPEIQGRLENLFNFSVKDQAGELKDMDQILGDMFVRYQALNQADKQQLLQIVGKKQQASRLAVIMQNYLTTLRNQVVTLRDANATESENRDIRATMISQVNSLKTAYEKLAVSATGAFGGQGVSFVASQFVRLLTNMLSLLEKGSGLFPIVAAGAGLFFAKFLAGAMALSRTRHETGLILNTVTALGEMYKDGAAIVGQWETAQLKAGRIVTRVNGLIKVQYNTMGRAILKMQEMSRSTNAWIALLGRAGRIINFTIGGLAKLGKMVGGFIAVSFIFSALNKLMDAFTSKAEKANRAAIGYDAALNRVVNTGKQFEVLGNMARRIREVADSADPAQLRKWTDELALAMGANRDEVAELKLRFSVENGVGSVKNEMEKIEAEMAASLEKQLNTIYDQYSDRIIKARELIELQTKSVEKSKRALWGIGWEKKSADPAKLEKLQEAEISLTDLMEKRAEVLSRIGKLQDQIVGSAIDRGLLESQVEGIIGRAGGIRDAMAPLGEVGKVIADSIKYDSIESNIKALIERTRSQYAPQIAALEQASKLPDGYKEMVEQSAARRAEILRLEDDLARLSSGPDELGMFVGNSGAVGANAIEKMAAEIQQKIAALNEEEEALQRTRSAELKRAADAQRASDELAKVTTRQNDAVNAINQAAEAHREEARLFREQEAAAMAYARRLDELARLRQETEASTARFGVGRNETVRSRATMEAISSEIAASRAREGGFELDLKFPILREKYAVAVKNVQEEMLRQNVLATHLQQEIVNSTSRQAQLEAEIANERIRQNEEAAKALGFAGREDQLRAALLEKFKAGGGQISASQFQFLSTDTREAIRTYQPDMLPQGLGNRLQELQAEMATVMSDAMIDAMRRARGDVQRVSGDRHGGVALPDTGGVAANSPVPAGVGPVSVNFDAGAVQVMVGEELKPFLEDLKELAVTRVDAAMGRLRQEVNQITTAMGVASARGVS